MSKFKKIKTQNSDHYLKSHAEPVFSIQSLADPESSSEQHFAHRNLEFVFLPGIYSICSGLYRLESGYRSMEFMKVLSLLQMRKLFTSLWFLGLITLLVFPLLAWLILFLTGEDFFALFHFEWPDLFSLPTFFSVGILFGLLVIYISELPYFGKSLSSYRNLLSNLKITRFHAVFLSFCAGFGEEVFFRGAIQPYLGIWITAIFFVAIHGYFSLKNVPVNIFASGLTLFIVVLGYAAKNFTLWHAIAGHFSYDLVLLMYYRRTSVYG